MQVVLGALIRRIRGVVGRTAALADSATGGTGVVAVGVVNGLHHDYRRAA